MQKLSFDFDAVTPRMMIDFRDKTGVSLMAALDEESGGFSMDKLPEEAIVGIVWLALRMSGTPDATWDDALDTPIAALDSGDDVVAEVAPDPTTASSAA